MEIKTLLAKSISYGGKRNRDNVTTIVIHYTGNKNDTAYANARYFATGNSRQAGAHFFVDRKGDVYKSINMNRIAYSVGGKYTVLGEAGKYYGKVTNANSVSIELCDCVDKEISREQKESLLRLVKYIKSKCSNVNKVIRHYDVNGKNCPAYYVSNKGAWKNLKASLENMI